MPQPNEQQNNNSDGSSNPNPDNQNNNPEAITPTNDTTKELILQLQREAFEREQASLRRIRELEDKLLTSSNGQTVQNNDPLPVDEAQFWQKPAEHLQGMIGRQVAPLLDFVEEQKKNNAYITLKNSYRHMDGFNAIEPLVDKYMAGKDATHANLQDAVRSSLGELVLSGKFNPQAPAAPAPTNQPPNNTPPQNNNNPRPQAHLRPTNTNTNQPPTNQDKPTRRPLTENERRLNKEFGLTEEEFWQNMEAESRVSTWEKKK